MNQNIAIGVLAAVILVVGVLNYTKDPVSVNVNKGDVQVVESEGSLGGFPGPDVYDSVYFQAGQSYGGGCFSTTTTGTLTVGDLSNGCIDITPAGAGQAVLSLTLPTAAQVNSEFLPSVGMCRDWVVDASDVAAATTTTFVAGSNMDLVGLDATGAGTGADVIDGAEYGKLTMCRQDGNRVTAYIEEWINAD